MKLQNYASGNDTLIMSGVRGITPVSGLSEKNTAVYEEGRKFLVGFDFRTNDYKKAKRGMRRLLARPSCANCGIQNPRDLRTIEDRFCFARCILLRFKWMKRWSCLKIVA